MTEDRAVSVRFADANDLDAMAEIYADSFDGLQPRLSIEQYLRPQGSWALIAEIAAEGSETPAGYVLCRIAADEAEIFSIGVARRFRRCGVGLSLLRAVDGIAAIRGALKVFLEVGIDNKAGRALYSKAGYELIGQRPDYYRNAGGDRVTALVLRKCLENIENRESC